MTGGIHSLPGPFTGVIREYVPCEGHAHADDVVSSHAAPSPIYTSRNCLSPIHADAPAAPLPALCSMFVGPRLILFNDTCPSAKYYFRRKMGPPGGAICVEAATTTSCTRFD